MNLLDSFEDIKRNQQLAELTTFRMGGKADFYIKVDDVMRVPDIIRAANANGVPYLVLGWGSNIIFSDKGFRGLIIHNTASNCELGETVEEIGDETDEFYRPAGQLLIADSGLLLSKVILYALENGLTGMEKLTGVPGTVGGAVRGNAGAFGLEIKHLFENALIYVPEEDQVKEVGFNYLDFSYRTSRLKKNSEILLKAAFRVFQGEIEESRSKCKEIAEYRSGRHPHGFSAGSFYKNPSRNSRGEGLSAGQLIEDCGFMGKTVGGAYISKQHGNFLMNDGKAVMLDVLELSTEIQQAVYAKHKIKLQREVVLVGEHGLIEDIY